MIHVKFGGALAEVLDGMSKITVKPRCIGEGRIVGRDEHHFRAAIPEMGGEEAVSVWVQGTIIRHTGRALVLLAASNGIVSAMNDVPALVRTATPLIDEELAEIGARIELDTITILLAPDDLEAIRKATVVVAHQKREQAMRPAMPTMFVPGTRVVARWTDDRERPATVRNFNGTHYEIVWDGATESTFLTPDRVRRP